MDDWQHLPISTRQQVFIIYVPLHMSYTLYITPRMESMFFFVTG